MPDRTENADSCMQLSLWLPTSVFLTATDVMRLVVETSHGSFGFLPHRRDCVTALRPGILIYESRSQGEQFVALDQGVLVKRGSQVNISVRRAIAGKALSELRHEVEQDFRQLSQQEQQLQQVMLKLESGFIHHFARFQHE